MRIQCAAQALPLRPPSVVAESAGSGQNVRIWAGVHARLHPLLMARGSHTHIETMPISFHYLFSPQKVVGGGGQRQLMDRTLQVVPRAQFDIVELGTRVALGSHLCEVAYSVRIYLFSAGGRHDSSLAKVVLCDPTVGLPFARGATGHCGQDHVARNSAIPSGQTKLGGTASSQTATIFPIGFFQATPADQTEESLPTGGSSKPPFPLGMYGGFTFPRGTCGGRRRGNFHRVFEPDISPLQGECAVLAQVLRDTPQDVPHNSLDRTQGYG